MLTEITSKLVFASRKIVLWYKRLKWKHRILLVLALAALLWYLLMLPDQLFKDPYSTVMYDRQGILLGAKIAPDGQWRFPEIKKIPDKLESCILAYEDQYFYYHPGFNPVALVRATISNVRAGKIVSGGSTITMQVVRLSRKGRERTVWEKLVEITVATRLELSKSKKEILRLYCSHAPYGGNVVGLEAASWRYFGYSSPELSWGEAALMAVLPNSPALIHPGRNRELLIRKRNLLLDKLFRLKAIDSTTLTVSKLEAIPDNPLPLPQIAPHLLSRIAVAQPGIQVVSTLDANIQTKTNEIVNKYAEIYRHNEVHNLAALIVEVKSGNVLAYVGNVNSPENNTNGGDVDIIVSPRSTGSLLKPILYGAMIEDGKILPGSLVPDIPTNFKGFAPQNFNQQFEGAVAAKNALARSLNVPAVRMLQEYGVDRFHQLLKQLGMSTIKQPASHYGLSLILGGAEGNLWDMVNIYACFSRVLNHYSQSGYYYKQDYHALNFQWQGSTGSIRADSSDQPVVLSASSIWSMYNAMHEVNRPDEETGWKMFSVPRRVAWKTGTSYGYRDGWAIGTTTEYVVGVWVGNADGEGRPGLTGIAMAAPVMFELFGLLPYTGWFKEPADEMIYASVCRQSGYKSGVYCEATDTIKIPYTCKMSPVCPFHKLIHLSPDGRYIVNSNCEDVQQMKHKKWFVLPPVQEWYYKNKHYDYVVLPPIKPGCGEGEIPSMDMIYPRDEVNIYIPVQLDGTKGRVIFEVAHRRPDTEIFWHLDDQFVTATRHFHQVELLPSEGWHCLTLVDENGEILRKRFFVIDEPK